MRRTIFLLMGLAMAAGRIGYGQGPKPQPLSLTDSDRTEIQGLVTRYARALASCSAEEFADLFAPVTGSFASGFRGELVGRDKLVALVQSEPHCTTATPGRPAGNAPTTAIDSTVDGVKGRADLGNAGHYEDVYVKTANGWKFKSREVITKQEETAGFGSKDFAELRKLAGDGLGYFDDVMRDTPAGRRLRSSGVVLTVTPEGATGKAYLRNDGGHYEDVYVRTSTGWRFKSRTYVAAAEPGVAASTASR